MCIKQHKGLRITSYNVCYTKLLRLLLAIGSLLTLLVGALTRNDGVAHAIAIVTTLLATLCALPTVPETATSLGLSDSILARTFTVFFCLMATGVLVFSQQYNQQRGMGGEEYPATILFVTFGMVALAVSTNLLTLFLGLEAMTFGFYILVAFDLRNNFV